MPPEILVTRQALLETLEREAKANGRIFFNGPHTRLIDLRVTPKDASEQKHLEMTFGPIGWHDFSIVNETYAQSLRQEQTQSLGKFINLQSVADGDIKHVKLTNIVCTNTTIITSDGSALYMHRGRRVSAAQGMICTVAENIHAEKDRSLEVPGDGDLPAPFRTALRGIEEELSPQLAKLIKPHALMMLGVAFNLRNLHPDIIFVAAVHLSADEMLKVIRQVPGKDFQESCKLSSVPVELGNPRLSSLLAEQKWLPGAKASFIRTIEFVNAAKDRWGVDVKSVCCRLADGDANGLE